MKVAMMDRGFARWGATSRSIDDEARRIEPIDAREFRRRPDQRARRRRRDIRLRLLCAFAARRRAYHPARRARSARARTTRAFRAQLSNPRLPERRGEAAADRTGADRRRLFPEDRAQADSRFEVEPHRGSRGVSLLPPPWVRLRLYLHMACEGDARVALSRRAAHRRSAAVASEFARGV